MDISKLGTKSFYLFVQSDNSSRYYPHNTGANFRVKLPERVILSGQWVCGLVEIRISSWTTPGGEHKPLYVTSNLIGDSIIGGTKLPALRRLFSSTSSTSPAFSHAFENILYFPLITHNFDEVEICLMHLPGENSSHLSGVTYCLMHFYKKSD